MSKEIIQHNNKKITKITKQNGDVSYSIKGVYIGTDVKTGKRITKTITSQTLKALDRKIIEAKIQFEFPMQGAFANVETPNDPYENQYLLYDVEQFPATFGAPTWFLKRGAEFKVTAKAEYSKNYGRNYYQISIVTDAAAEDAFATGATRGAAPSLGGHTATTDFNADLGGADTEAAPVNDLSGLL